MTPQHPHSSDPDQHPAQDDTLDLHDDLDLDEPVEHGLSASSLGGSLGGSLHHDDSDLHNLHDGGRQPLGTSRPSQGFTQTPLPVNVVSAEAPHTSSADSLDLDDDLDLNEETAPNVPPPVRQTPTPGPSKLFRFSEPEAAPVTPVDVTDTAQTKLRPTARPVVMSEPLRPIPGFDDVSGLDDTSDVDDPAQPTQDVAPARTSRFPKIGRGRPNTPRAPKPARIVREKSDARAARPPMTASRKLLVLAGVLAVTAALATAAVMTFTSSAKETATLGLQSTTGGDLSLPAQPSAVPSSGLPGINAASPEAETSASRSGAPVFIPDTGATTTAATGSQPGTTATGSTTSAPSSAETQNTAETQNPAPSKTPAVAETPATAQTPAKNQNPSGIRKPTGTQPASAVAAASAKPSKPSMRDPFAAQQGLGDPATDATASTSTSSAAPVVMRSPRTVSSYPATLPTPTVIPASVPAPVVTRTPVQSVQVPATAPVQMPTANSVQVQQMPSAPAVSTTSLPQFPSPVTTPQAVLIPAKPVHVNQAQAAVRQIGLSLSGTHKTGNADVALLTTRAGGYQEVTAGDTLPELNATVTAVTASSLTLKVGKDSVKLTLGEPQK